MGTKLQPGKFDCYAKAEPDEPTFTLLARDPLAGFFVSMWAHVRSGDIEAACVVFETMLERVGTDYALHPDTEKPGEALECSQAMFSWLFDHRKPLEQEIPGGLAITREDLSPSRPAFGLCPFTLYSQGCGLDPSQVFEGSCDKTFQTCRDKFHNLSHFGGLMKPYEG